VRSCRLDRCPDKNWGAILTLIEASRSQHLVNRYIAAAPRLEDADADSHWAVSTFDEWRPSASTACVRGALAPLRKTSVNGSAKLPGRQNCKTLVSVMACLSSMESGGFEHRHDTPPHPFMTSPTFERSPPAADALGLPFLIARVYATDLRTCNTFSS
jgi:hypothetical protein